MPLSITAAVSEPALLDLPWSLPLEDWPADRLVSLPRGISRHVVRFARIGGTVYAIKEIPQRLAEREYRLLRDLDRLDVPAVEAVGVTSGRATTAGEPIEPALVTRHLQFSLPYRALLSRTLRPETMNRLLDALVLLLVRLHLAGFYWGDCSLSNTLFRRDAGTFAAYLVDAETGELHPRQLTDGQRAHDLDNAQVNIFGELLDLSAGEFLDPDIDPAEMAEEIIRRYEGLWQELTHTEVIGTAERYKLDAWIRRLNDLGFDVAEVSMVTDAGSPVYKLQPKVVEAGHHSRRLLRLTGLEVQENQARRLLNDLAAYAASAGADPDDEVVAHRWLAEVFEPVVRAVPRDLRRKLEPAEIYHEVLEHRWFLSERAGRDVGLRVTIDSYIEDVLAFKPDEKAVLGASLGTPSENGGQPRVTTMGDTQEIPPIAG